jgi:hypothetical protein
VCVGSSPTRGTNSCVAQLDRAFDYGSKGWGFESLHGYNAPVAKLVARDRLKICWSGMIVPVRARPGVQNGLIAQLDRALGFYPSGFRFES